ncbi:MAG: DUF1801 domain-containing protein [Pseudomonadota bacterium]
MGPDVKQKFASYPEKVRIILIYIRDLIFEVAQAEGLGAIEETLKWGEPSYLAKGGSPLRIDWKPKFPRQLFVYFNCKTTLVETFKEVFGDSFHYEGNRAIVFAVSENIPLAELKICISVSLKYHKVKNLPLLGL